MMVNVHTQYVDCNKGTWHVGRHSDDGSACWIMLIVGGETVLHMCGLNEKSLKALESAIRADLIDSETVCLGDGV